MNVLIDLVGASLVVGVIILMVVSMNSSVADLGFQTTFDAVTQSNSATIADLINYDFYKIGYGDTINGAKPIIELADSNRIQYRADVDRDGTVDTIKYETKSSPFTIPGTQIHFRELYREVNSTSGSGALLGITYFRFSYFNSAGQLIALPSPTDSASLTAIRSIKVQMFVKNPIAADTLMTASFDSAFSTTYWEKWISPKNLRPMK